MNVLLDSKNEWNAKVEKLSVWNGLNKLYPLLKPKSSLRMDPNDINNFFCTISTRDPTAPLPPLPNKPINMHACDPASFQLTRIDNATLLALWRSMKNKQSQSYDNLGFCNKMLSLSLSSPRFCDYLCEVLNSFIDNGYIPPQLKISKVIPIPKIRAPTTPNDLRPISVQPLLTKILGKSIFNDLTEPFSY